MYFFALGNGTDEPFIDHHIFVRPFVNFFHHFLNAYTQSGNRYHKQC